MGFMESEIQYDYKKTPAFVTPDGECYESKWLYGENHIVVSNKQWDELVGSNIIIVGAGGVLEVVKFADLLAGNTNYHLRSWGG